MGVGVVGVYEGPETALVRARVHLLGSHLQLE